jgi:hypothetical protein
MSTDTSDLIARLHKALPNADERESNWCCLQGYDLRAAVELIETLRAQVEALRASIKMGDSKQQETI